MRRLRSEPDVHRKSKIVILANFWVIIQLRETPSQASDLE